MGDEIWEAGGGVEGVEEGVGLAVGEAEGEAAGGLGEEIEVVRAGRVVSLHGGGRGDVVMAREDGSSATQLLTGCST